MRLYEPAYLCVCETHIKFYFKRVSEKLYSSPHQRKIFPMWQRASLFEHIFISSFHP